MGVQGNGSLRPLGFRSHRRRDNSTPRGNSPAGSVSSNSRFTDARAGRLRRAAAVAIEKGIMATADCNAVRVALRQERGSGASVGRHRIRRQATRSRRLESSRPKLEAKYLDPIRLQLSSPSQQSRFQLLVADSSNTFRTFVQKVAAEVCPDAALTLFQEGVEVLRHF